MMGTLDYMAPELLAGGSATSAGIATRKLLP